MVLRYVASTTASDRNGVTMGARGVLKLPAHLRAVPTESDAPTTVADRAKPVAPDRPKTLPASLNAMWDEITGSLDELGLLTRCDAPALELALRHYAAAVHASDELADLGSVAVEDDKNKRLMKHPAHQVFRDHSTAFLEFAKQLGLTFVARARTVAPKEPEGGEQSNPFAASG